MRKFSCKSWRNQCSPRVWEWSIQVTCSQRKPRVWCTGPGTLSFSLCSLVTDLFLSLPSLPVVAGCTFPCVPLHPPQPISKWVRVYPGLGFDTLDILINSCPKLLLANQIFTFSKDFASDLFSKVKCTKLTLTFRENGRQTKSRERRYKLCGSWGLQAPEKWFSREFHVIWKHFLSAEVIYLIFFLTAEFSFRKRACMEFLIH